MDGASDTQLWGERFHRTFVDIFELEEEAAAITHELQLQLSGEDKRALGKRYKSNAARTNSSCEVSIIRRRSPGGVAKALECFLEATRIDPGNVSPKLNLPKQGGGSESRKALGYK